VECSQRVAVLRTAEPAEQTENRGENINDSHGTNKLPRGESNL